MKCYVYNTSITIYAKELTTVQIAGPGICKKKKIQEEPGRRWNYVFEREKKTGFYHAREDAIKPRCKLQVPSAPHTGTIPHHAVRSSRQSMRFTPCLLVMSASPGVRRHR